MEILRSKVDVSDFTCFDSKTSVIPNEYSAFSESREGPRSDEILGANISKTDDMNFIAITFILYIPC